MPTKVEVSTVIERSVDKVFHFCAYEHVRNHPRWDKNIELEQVSEGPIGVGTKIRRRNSRSGTPVEGTMEVVAFEHNREIRVVIHDGPVKMLGWITFEPVSENQTTIKRGTELPDMDKSMDPSFLTREMESVGNIIKQLIESEEDE
jgi:hypothetical protein